MKTSIWVDLLKWLELLNLEHRGLVRKQLLNAIKRGCFIFGALMILGCSSDSASDPEDEINQTAEGTVAELRKFYNDSFVDTMISLGFQIHQGKTPPDLSGSYLITPFVLNASNIPGDEDNIGEGIGQYQADFSNQNNSLLSLDFLGTSGAGLQQDEGPGSFVIGSNGAFGVFAKTTTTVGSSTAITAVAISGKLTENGIEDVQFFGAMLDDQGDPQKIFIENNSGRLYIDGDGEAEKVSM